MAVFRLLYIHQVIFNLLSVSMENLECYSLQYKEMKINSTNLLMRYSECKLNEPE